MTRRGSPLIEAISGATPQSVKGSGSAGRICATGPFMRVMTAKTRRGYHTYGGGSRVAVTLVPPANTSVPAFQYKAFSTAMGW